MMPLAKFLLDCIAEEEAAAHDWQPEDPPSDCWDPGRVLLECDIKRRIIARAEAHIAAGAPGNQAMTFTLLDLAIVYEDHPDFREEWSRE